MRCYGDEGLAGLAPRSRRPASCPHRMPGEVEARVLELRRVHPGWGPRRILYDLQHRPDLADPVQPTRSAIAVVACPASSPATDAPAARTA
ncbi:helix-turn-helix domain-containing protein [Kribbella sp. NPDC051137]|uniref:helix-turn-helix domain-containing protein n=1 Tax=Kribbella TaxID=182639 RepID=UPI003434CE9E